MRGTFAVVACGVAFAVSAGTLVAEGATAPRIPATLAGLPVVREDVSKVVDLKSNQVAADSVDMYSLRRPDKLLEATLEVAHLGSGVDAGSSTTRASIVNLVGNSIPVDLRIGADDIYITRSKGVTDVTWFRGRYLFVLSIRNEFTQPKQLIREALGVNP